MNSFIRIFIWFFVPFFFCIANSTKATPLVTFPKKKSFHRCLGSPKTNHQRKKKKAPKEFSPRPNIFPATLRPLQHGEAILHLIDNLNAIKIEPFNNALIRYENSGAPINYFIEKILEQQNDVLKHFKWLLKYKYHPMSLDYMILMAATRELSREINQTKKFTKKKKRTNDYLKPLYHKPQEEADFRDFLRAKYGFLKGLLTHMFIAAQLKNVEGFEVPFVDLLGYEQALNFLYQEFPNTQWRHANIHGLPGIDIVTIENGVEYWVEVKNINTSWNKKVFEALYSQQIQKQLRAVQFAKQQAPQRKIKIIVFFYSHENSLKDLNWANKLHPDVMFVDAKLKFGVIPNYFAD